MPSSTRVRRVDWCAVNPIRPFLRWAGGKRWSTQFITDHIDCCGAMVDYDEPFVGGGAWLAAVLNRPALVGRIRIGDLAPEVSTIYQALLSSPVTTANAAQRWFDHITTAKDPQAAYVEARAFWNTIRPTHRASGSQTPVWSIDAAGLLIALNRTGFKGLLRVNSRGEFNTPYGHLPEPSLDTRGIMEFGLAMKRMGVEFVPGSWEWISDPIPASDAGTVSRMAGRSDHGFESRGRVRFLAVDPPYAGTTHTAYHESGWTQLNQLQLSHAVRDIAARPGTAVFATDADFAHSYKAWSWGNPARVQRRGGMGDGEGSGIEKTSEIIIRTFRTFRPPEGPFSGDLL